MPARYVRLPQKEQPNQYYDEDPEQKDRQSGERSQNGPAQNQAQSKNEREDLNDVTEHGPAHDADEQ